MDSILFCLLAAVAVPDVTAGPDLVEQAAKIDAPISEVTVFSDRAKIRRRAEVGLKEGVQTLRLNDLPGAVRLDTVRLTCTEAKVLRVEASPVERERFSIDQVDALLDRLEQLGDQRALLDAEARVLELELAFLGGVKPKPPVDESKRVGQALPPVLPELWKQALDFLAERRQRDQAKLRGLGAARRELDEKFAKVQREVNQHDLGGFVDRKIQVVAILDAPHAGKTKLELEYFVPGASWIPTYDVHFAPDQGKVTLNTAGMVQHATGEDWNDVVVKLSTAIPGQGIELPELLTWALGEKREFIPQAIPARMPAAAGRFAPPAPRVTAAEAERGAKLDVAQERLSELRTLAEAADLGAGLSWLASQSDGPTTTARTRDTRTSLVPNKNGKKTKELQFESVTVDGSLVRPESTVVAPGARLSAPAPSRPSPRLMEMKPARAVESEAEPWEDLELSLHAERSSRRDSVPVLTTSLGLFEPVFYQRPQFSDPNLPAVAAGGLDYVYSCPTRATIPSTGKRFRLPLASEKYPVSAFYEATPSLMNTAFMKAKVNNQGDRPILTGPVNIFVNKDFVGQGALRTTGPGGVIELPLGADEDIRLLRKVVPSTAIKGLISKDEVTTYQVTVEVGNYKKRPARIAIFDQVPKTNNEDIEIELGKTSPRPAKGPDEDGVLRWDLDIPAGKTQTIQFSYQILRPTGWQLRQ